MKQDKRIEAIKLRQKGASIKEISQELGVAQSTVSVWSRDVALSSKARRILKEKTIAGRKKATNTLRLRTENKLKLANNSANKTLRLVARDTSSLKLLCAMIYWCEGSKTRNDSALTFTNSDPELVAFFLSLLRQAFRVDESRFRILMHLHAYHDVRKQLRFWSKVTNIQPPQFLRTYQKVNTGKHLRDGYQGCVSVRYHDVELAREIQALARSAMKPGSIV